MVIPETKTHCVQHKKEQHQSEVLLGFSTLVQYIVHIFKFICVIIPAQFTVPTNDLINNVNVTAQRLIITALVAIVGTKRLCSEKTFTLQGFVS